MDSPEPDPMRARIREAIRVEQFYPPPSRPLPEAIADTERKLGVPMPPWLREVYLCCNGFSGPTDECYLYPLEGGKSVANFTLFLRGEEWAPAWLNRAIVFGYTGGSGSGTTHAVALDGRLIEWCYGDGDQFTVLDGGLFALWRRIQAEWDELD